MNEFQQALKGLYEDTAKIIKTVPLSVGNHAREIRLRSGRKICIVTADGDYFLDHIIYQEELYECFRSLCSYSVHSHEEEIRQGYITIKGGHRAGLCGTAVYKNGDITNIRNISSINIRIARQIFGAADELYTYFNGSLEKTLLVGPPSSGKTTLLKDIIHRLNNKKITVVDSRGEIAACSNGVPQNDLGNADILDGWKKADGMMMAIRTMGPDVIICDEIGDKDDALAIESCLNAGVSVIATTHAGSLKELSLRRHIMDILKLGAFEQLVILAGKNQPGHLKTILKAGELSAFIGSDTSGNMPDIYRAATIQKIN